MKGRKGTPHRAAGGIVEAGGNPNVFADLKERKKGGRVEKDAGKVASDLGKFRLDKPGRKRGGRVGADMSPLSSAHKTTGAGGPPSQVGSASD